MRTTKNSGQSVPSRRAFLKAAGITIALPSMESVAANPQAGAAPMRMVCVTSALGMNPSAFFPTSYDKNFDGIAKLKFHAGKLGWIQIVFGGNTA